MKKLFVLTIILVLMFSSVASAGIFDWFGGITGMNTAEGENSAGEAPSSVGDSSGGDSSGGDNTGGDSSVGDSSGEGSSSEESSSGGAGGGDSTEEYYDNSEDNYVEEEYYDDSEDNYIEEEYDNYVEEEYYDDSEDNYVEEEYYGNQKDDKDCECWKGDQCVPCPKDDNYDNKRKDDKKPKNAPKDRMMAPGFDEKKEEFFPGDEMKEKYGESWCAGGQCCPDNICDDFEQKTHGCPMDCGWEDGGQYECIDHETLEIKKQDCLNQGGNFEVHGSDECPEPFCQFSGGGFFGGGDCDNIEPEIQKCESMGMYADVKSSCMVECKSMGSKGVGQIKEEIPEAKALQIVLKLDSVIIKFTKLETNLNKLADFYEAEDPEMAENYREAANHLGEVQGVLSGIKDDMATLLEEKGKLEQRDLYNFKNKFRKIVDDTLTKTLYLMLGVEPSESLEEEDHSMTDCKTDALCFMNNFEQCAVSTTYNPEEGMFVEIMNMDEDSNQDCHINVNKDGKDHFCNFPIEVWKYDSPSPELFEMYCEQFEEVMGDSGMTCCQPESVSGYACMIDKGASCANGFKQLEGEWLDPGDMYNCVGHKVGETGRVCETVVGEEIYVIEEPVEEVIEESVEEIVEDIVEEGTEESVEEIVENIVEEGTEESTEEIIEDIVDDILNEEEVI